ncbi:MAG: GatB/YqeY domain-containing protein [Dehalococcoidia bacterium]
MSALSDSVQSDLASAMRARDDVRKATLRLLIAALKNAEIEARKPLDDDGVLAVIQKQAKQRKESIAEYEKAGRDDLVARESAELKVLEEYLPTGASADEIVAAAKRVIAETGAEGPRAIGKVMPVLMKEFAGRADGREVNRVVRELLSG